MDKESIDHKKSAKHTPGPWEAAEHGDYGDYDGQCIVVLGDDLRIAVVLGDDTPETRANVRLIAAAPDSYAANKEALAALYGCREVLGEVANVQHAIDLLTAAIAKATGPEPFELPTTQRKPLTDEEMFRAVRNLYATDELAQLALQTSKDEYRAIEAAHGIKNDE